MTETHILFLAPNWRVSLIRAFKESQNRLGLSGRVVGADSDPQAAVNGLGGKVGQGQDALAAAVGELGKSCGGCHKPYRQPKD